MKLYLAIAFALLMATAYGFRNKQEATTATNATTTTGAAVDTTDATTDYTTAVDPVDTTESTPTCDQSSDEYENGNGQCTWTNSWCNGVDGSSTSDYTDTCTDGSYSTSHCDNSYGDEWSEGTCTSSGCSSDNCYDCSNDYYSTYTTVEMGSNYNNNSCTNTDGSSDCKLAYSIILLTSLCIFYSFLLYSKLQFMR
jgi:hypothetical protein